MSGDDNVDGRSSFHKGMEFGFSGTQWWRKGVTRMEVISVARDISGGPTIGPYDGTTFQDIASDIQGMGERLEPVLVGVIPADDLPTPVVWQTHIMLMIILALCFAILATVSVACVCFLRKYAHTGRTHQGYCQKVFQTTLATKATSITGLYPGVEDFMLHKNAYDATDDKECHSSTDGKKLSATGSETAQHTKFFSKENECPKFQHTNMQQSLGKQGDCMATRSPGISALMKPVAWYVPLHDVRIRHSKDFAVDHHLLDVTNSRRNVGLKSHVPEVFSASQVGPNLADCDMKPPERAEVNMCGGEVSGGRQRGHGFKARLHENTCWEQREERPVMFMGVNAAINQPEHAT